MSDRRIAASLLVAWVAVAAAALPPTAASAATASTTLTDKATGLCLDSNTSSSVYTLACNGGNFQQWTATPVDNFGTVKLVDLSTLMCLDSNSSGSVYTLACNGGANQKWSLTPDDPAGSAPSELRDIATGRCLDSNSSGSVYTLACNGGANQRWQQPPPQPFPLTITHNGGQLCIGISGSDAAGSWPCTGASDQSWHWGAGNAHGHNLLVNGDGRCLQVQADGVSQGSVLVAYTCPSAGHYTRSMFWARTDTPWSATSPLENYGTSDPVNAPAGLFASTPGGLFIAGQQLVIRAFSGSDDQKWSSPPPSFNIANNQAAGRCAGIFNGAAGLWDCTRHPDQVWHWGPNNGSGAQLVNGYGQCLGVAGGTVTQGAALAARTCDSGADLYWSRVVGTSVDNPVQLVNTVPGSVGGQPVALVIAVNGGGTANGTALILWTSVGSPDQVWYVG